MDLDTIGTIGIVIAVLSIAIGVAILTASVVLTFERITVEGEVIDVDALDDYLLISMDDGEEYKIAYPGDNIDLTVNSKIIMRLENFNFFFIDDGFWNDVSITKVP